MLKCPEVIHLQLPKPTIFDINLVLYDVGNLTKNVNAAAAAFAICDLLVIK